MNFFLLELMLSPYIYIETTLPPVFHPDTCLGPHEGNASMFTTTNGSSYPQVMVVSPLIHWLRLFLQKHEKQHFSGTDPLWIPDFVDMRCLVSQSDSYQPVARRFFTLH
jgi:hypothetical protein